MICRLYELQVDMAMRLAFFRDCPEGFGKWPPGTLHDMGVLEAKIEALLEAIEDDGEVLAEVCSAASSTWPASAPPSPPP